MEPGSDITLLTDEKFDFDISLSPTSAKEDEDCDEVFIGPVGHREKCVSAVIRCKESEEKTPPLNSEHSVWSPLSGDKFVEIFKEAHLLALQLECFSSSDQKNMEPPQTAQKPVVEKFVEESKTKVNLFDTFNEVNKTPIALKRETYCIQDSPFHQLPPSIQQRFAVPKTGSESQPAVEPPNSASPLKVPKVVKNFSVSPLAQKIKAKPLKSNVPLSNIGTGSKLQTLKAPAVHMKNNRLAVEKPKPAKKISPIGRRNLSSMGSTEDLLSDKSSIASDVSDSSFNSSIVGPSKRSLPVPNKAGLNKIQFKTPSAAVAFRKNTTSSSSSQSSLNSSISASPAASAKLNTSINTSLNNSVSSSRQKPNTCKLALVRPLGAASSALKTTASDMSHNSLKPSVLTKAKNSKSTSVCVADSQTPAGKFHRQTSAPNLQRLHSTSKPEGATKALTAKPQARVMPTPTSRLKLPHKTDGPSPDRAAGKPMKPTRLLSCGEIGSGIGQSTPIRATKGVLANSGLGRGIPSTPSTKLVSALPTPLSRRTSGIATPRTVPRSFSSLRPAAALQVSSKSIVKPDKPGPAECEQMKTKVTKSPCSPSEDNATSAICCSLNFSPENKPAPLSQMGNQQLVAHPLPAEVLLIDIGVNDDNKKERNPSSIEIDSQPLIDLSNTPELNKRLVPLKASNVGQLIDLSSPLIQLSPAVNKENVEMDYPLLTF